MTFLDYMNPGYGDAFYPDADIAFAGAFGVFILIYGVAMLLAMAISVASYVLHSLGLYTIAQRRGIHNPWLAWIPVGNLWLLGSISDQYQYLVKGKIKTRRRMMLGLGITAVVLCVILMICAVMQVVAGNAAVAVLLAFISIFGLWALAIALLVYEYMCYYDLYRSCEKTNGVLYLVLSIVISATLPFLVFACRKKDEGMPPRKKPAPVVEIVEEAAPAEEKAEPVEEGFAQPEEFEEV